MKQDTKIQLDKLQREERNKNIIRLVCTFFALVALFSAVLLYRYHPGKTNEVFGVVTGLNGVPVPKRGEILYLMVELDNGKVVEVKKPNTIPFKKNERVKLTETKSSMFGNKRYDFIKYQNRK
jgi:hypothetical protein